MARELEASICILSHKIQINFIPTQSRMLQIVVRSAAVLQAAAWWSRGLIGLAWCPGHRPGACRLPFRIFHHSSQHHQNDHLKPRKHGLTLVIIPNRTCISSQCQNHRPTIYNLIYENNFKTPTVLTLEIRAKIIILDWSSGILTLGVGLFLFSFSCLYFCGSY